MQECGISNPNLPSSKRFLLLSGLCMKIFKRDRNDKLVISEYFHSKGSNFVFSLFHCDVQPNLSWKSRQQSSPKLEAEPFPGAPGTAGAVASSSVAPARTQVRVRGLQLSWCPRSKYAGASGLRPFALIPHARLFGLTSSGMSHCSRVGYGIFGLGSPLQCPSSA